MADINIAIMPGEAILVAAMELTGKIIDLAKEDRSTMDPEIRKRFDDVRIKGLERMERILQGIEDTFGIGKKG